MNTVGTQRSTVIPVEESWLIAQTFVCDTQVEAGAIVALQADGTVTPATSLSPCPIGMVTVANRVATGKVTVNTVFSAIVIGQAGEDITCGDKLNVSGYDTVTKKGTYTIAPGGLGTGVIVAIALQTSLNGEELKVGILRSFKY